MPQGVSYPSEFALLYCVQDVFLDSLQQFIIQYPVNPAIFSILLETHISKANSISLSAWVIVHVSSICPYHTICKIYSAPLHKKTLQHQYINNRR